MPELKECPHCGSTNKRAEVIEIEALGQAFEVEIAQCASCWEYFVVGLLNKRQV